MRKIFYGWWMVGAGSVMQFVQGTLVLHAFGAYFAVLRDDRGWSKTELSGAAAMHQLEAAVLGPLLGWFLDRFGPQWVIRTGAVVFGCGFMLLSQIDSLLAFYGAFIMTAIGASLCGFFPMNVALVHCFALFVVMGVNTHAITHMKEGLGYSIEVASLVITLQTVAQLCGVGIGAWIGDRLNKRLISAGCMLGHMAGLLFLTYAVNGAMIVAYALLHGAAWGLRGPMMQAIRADYFGRSAIGMILGLSFMIIVIGQVGGPMIAGMLSDLTGNYRAGFTVLALLAGLGSAFFLFAKRPARPVRERR